MLDVLRLAQKIGIDFAFPTQTLHVFNESGSPGIEPKIVPPHFPDTLREDGKNAAREILSGS